jgi:hypothetical protein
MGYELKKLMNMYGVSTPTMAAAPQKLGDAPTALADGATAEQQAKYAADKAAFDENVRKYGLNQAQYDQYARDYQNRLANTNMYNQAQFNTSGINVMPQFADMLRSPVYEPLTAINVMPPVDTMNQTAAPPVENSDQRGGGRDRDGMGGMGVSSAPSSGGYTGLRDRFDGGGPGVRGGRFEGGGRLSDIANAITGRARGGHIQNYAQGGSVKGYRPGGPVDMLYGGAGNAMMMGRPAGDRLTAPPSIDPNAALEAMLNRYVPPTVTSEQIAAASERRVAEQKAFEDILRSQLQSSDSEPMSKAEKYFRLAAAFGAPTKTGHFAENLGLVGEEMSSQLAAKAQREREARERGLGVELEIQKMRMGTAGEEYDALRGIQSEEAKYRRDVANELLKEQIASGKAGYTQVTGAELGLTGEDAGKLFNVSPNDKVTAIDGSGTTVNVGGEGQDALNKKLAEAEGAILGAALKQGPIAGAAMNDLMLLGEVLQFAPQSPITGRLAEAFPGVSSAGAAAQSIIKRVAPTLRAEGSGSTSDIEYAGMLNSLPSLQNYPEANAAILGMMKAKAAIDIERAQIVRDYANSGQKPEDAKAMRDRLTEIDSRSIMTPELRNTIAMLDGTGAAGEGGDEPVVIDGVTIRKVN